MRPGLSPGPIKKYKPTYEIFTTLVVPTTLSVVGTTRRKILFAMGKYCLQWEKYCYKYNGSVIMLKIIVECVVSSVILVGTVIYYSPRLLVNAVDNIKEEIDRKIEMDSTF